MTSPPSEGPADWGFAGQEDAARYLRELLRLWTVWVVGLAVLMTNNGVVLAVGAVVVVGLLVWFARPIQRRADAVPSPDHDPEHDPPAGHKTARSSTRAGDRTLREFAYGEKPLEAAVALTGQSAAWLFARKVVIAATVVAFAAFFVQSLG